MKILKGLDVAGLQREFKTGGRIDTESGCLFVWGQRLLTI